MAISHTPTSTLGLTPREGGRPTPHHRPLSRCRSVASRDCGTCQVTCSPKEAHPFAPGNRLHLRSTSCVRISHSAGSEPVECGVRTEQQDVSDASGTRQVSNAPSLPIWCGACWPPRTLSAGQRSVVCPLPSLRDQQLDRKGESDAGCDSPSCAECHECCVVARAILPDHWIRSQKRRSETKIEIGMCRDCL